MDRNWQPGDRAIYTRPCSECCGLEVTIVGPIGNHEASSITGLGAFSGYRFDPGFPPTHKNGYWAGPTKYFRPIYDGNETVSWESMKKIWVPSPVVTI